MTGARPVIAGLAAMVALACAGSVGLAQPNPRDAEATLALVEDAPQFVRDGAMEYDYHCSACHGDTGRGMAEARTSFPPSHRNCTRCHRPHNPPQMAPGAITPNSAFDVGEAPALLGDDADLSAFGTAEGLLGYVRATMPRPFPASLDEEVYRRIVAFLAYADGAELPDGGLTPEAAASIELP